MNTQVVIFKLAVEEYGIKISKVQEIVRMSGITLIPRAPSWVKGVINLRGHVVPVISLGARFGLPCKDYDKTTRVVVVDIGGNRVGLIVDSVTEVAVIAEDQMQPPPKGAVNLDSQYIESLARAGDRLVIMLDIRRILPQD